MRKILHLDNRQEFIVNDSVILDRHEIANALNNHLVL